MPASIGRLKTRPEFLQVARRGRKWVSQGLVLQGWARPGLAGACARQEPGGPATAIRFGITASRKVGGAVERNRAKRRLRAAAAEVLPVAGRPGTDYVLIARAETLRRPYMELVRDLSGAVEGLERKSKAPRPAGRAGSDETGRS